MGQKVNPVGFRLGTSRDHDSIWFAKSKDYSKLVLQDLKIRKRVKEILPQAPISAVVIKRTMEEVIVDIKTSRPGIVIGKKGEEIEKIKSELKKVVKQDVKLNVVEVKQPDLDAQLVADSVTQQLEKRIMFRKAMKRAVQNTMRQGAKGIRIEVSGRLNGAEIARSEWYREGRVPLHTLKADIDYATSEALTTYGILGVKVWIYRGHAMVTSRQIEAARRALVRYIKRGGKVWIRVFPDKPITKKPLETRQGKGKGNVEYWASPVRPGKILYEVAGVSEKDAKKAFELASAKLPMATTFTKRGANG